MLDARAIALLSIVAALLSTAPSCDCSSADDAPSERATGSSPGRPRATHPLEGSWSGSATVPGQGVVAGVITVDERGHGIAVLSLRGVTITETIQIEAWNGTTLRVVHRGTPYTLTAELDGSTLYAQLPVIGWTRLERRTKARSRPQ